MKQSSGPASSALVMPEDVAAERLNISPRTLQRWRRLNLGPAFVKLGGRVAYREAALLAYVEQNERKTSAA